MWMTAHCYHVDRLGSMMGHWSDPFLAGTCRNKGLYDFSFPSKLPILWAQNVLWGKDKELLHRRRFRGLPSATRRCGSMAQKTRFHPRGVALLEAMKHEKIKPVPNSETLRNFPCTSSPWDPELISVGPWTNLNHQGTVPASPVAQLWFPWATAGSKFSDKSTKRKSTGNLLLEEFCKS